MNARTTIFTAATGFALMAAAAPAAQPNHGQRPLQLQAQHDSPTSLRVELTSDRRRHGDFRRLQVRIYRGAPSDQGGEHESTAEATGLAQQGRMTFELELSEQAGSDEAMYLELWRRYGRNVWLREIEVNPTELPPIGTPYGDDQATPPDDGAFSAENAYRSAGDPADFGDGSDAQADAAPQPRNPFSTPQDDVNDFGDFGDGSSNDQSTGDSSRSPFADANGNGLEEDFGDGSTPVEPADLNGDGQIDTEDLVQLVLAWGDCDHRPCSEDLNIDGLIDVDDLIIFLTRY